MVSTRFLTLMILTCSIYAFSEDGDKSKPIRQCKIVVAGASEQPRILRELQKGKNLETERQADQLNLSFEVFLSEEYYGLTTFSFRNSVGSVNSYRLANPTPLIDMGTYLKDSTQPANMISKLSTVADYKVVLSDGYGGNLGFMIPGIEKPRLLLIGATTHSLHHFPREAISAKVFYDTSVIEGHLKFDTALRMTIPKYAGLAQDSRPITEKEWSQSATGMQLMSGNLSMSYFEQSIPYHALMIQAGALKKYDAIYDLGNEVSKTKDLHQLLRNYKKMVNRDGFITLEFPIVAEKPKLGPPEGFRLVKFQIQHGETTKEVAGDIFFSSIPGFELFYGYTKMGPLLTKRPDSPLIQLGRSLVEQTSLYPDTFRVQHVVLKNRDPNINFSIETVLDSTAQNILGPTRIYTLILPTN